MLVRYAFTVGIAATLLIGCGLHPSGAPGDSVAQVVRIGNNSLAVTDRTCKSKGGVSVTPCTVTLTASKPSAHVSAAGPGIGTFKAKTEHCSRRGIATVVPESNDTFLVTAGIADGTCQTIFSYRNAKHRRVGQATLYIANDVP